MVHVSRNEDGHDVTAAPFEGYGMRHRSAFRFVEQMPASIAFVLSQDGGIKAVAKVNERIVMWPYFEVGYTTALS